MNYVRVDIHNRYDVLNSAVLYETSERTACAGELMPLGLRHGPSTVSQVSRLSRNCFKKSLTGFGSIVYILLIGPLEVS